GRGPLLAIDGARLYSTSPCDARISMRAIGNGTALAVPALEGWPRRPVRQEPDERSFGPGTRRSGPRWLFTRPSRRRPMATRKLDKKEWRTFFDRVSKMVEGKQAEIEVASLRLGAQVQAEWLPLHGITYDPKDDLVEVILEGLDHMISKPREIY